MSLEAKLSSLANDILDFINTYFISIFKRRKKVTVLREYTLESSEIYTRKKFHNKHQPNDFQKVLELIDDELRISKKIIYDDKGYPISIEVGFLESLEENEDSYIITNRITQKKTIIRKIPKNVIFK